MDPNKKLLKDEGELFEDTGRYRHLVGKLKYLTITRLDISYAVNVVSQFLEAPQVSHWEAITRIIRYVKKQPSLRILYRPNGHLRVEGFTNANWAGSSDKRSMTRYCTFFSDNLVTCKSKKQTVVARSSAKAKYGAMTHIAIELTWLQHFLQEIGFSVATPIPLSCDN